MITTAEEAAYPWANYAGLAYELDAKARAARVTLLGTGVNPGFTFDALVLTASGASWDVSGFDVERIVDISGYGEAILRRSGVGFTRDQFERGCNEGSITGHIGFAQSMYVVAHALGRDIERIERSITPILSETALEVSGVAIAPGETAGFTQRHVAIVDGAPWFVAHLVAHVAMKDAGLVPRDTIEIGGTVPVRLVADPGVIFLDDRGGRDRQLALPRRESGARGGAPWRSSHRRTRAGVAELRLRPSAARCRSRGPVDDIFGPAEAPGARRRPP